MQFRGARGSKATECQNDNRGRRGNRQGEAMRTRRCWVEQLAPTDGDESDAHSSGKGNRGERNARESVMMRLRTKYGAYDRKEREFDDRPPERYRDEERRVVSDKETKPDTPAADHQQRGHGERRENGGKRHPVLEDSQDAAATSHAKDCGKRSQYRTKRGPARHDTEALYQRCRRRLRVTGSVNAAQI